jgi:hypothetical protein
MAQIYASCGISRRVFSSKHFSTHRPRRANAA